MSKREDRFPHIEEIISVLICAKSPLTAVQIRKKLSYIGKTEINRTLYKNEEVFTEEPGRPPVWSLVQSREDQFEEEHPEVWIDLLNSSDVADEIGQYDYIQTRGYCNEIYQGVKPEGKIIVLPVEKGLLQLQLIADLALHSNGEEKKQILLCSRDKIFENVSMLFNNVVLCRSVRELKMQL